MANESDRISRIERLLREQGYGDALDALKGLAWEDDRQVVDLRTRWAEIEGCRITVRQA